MFLALYSLTAVKALAQGRIEDCDAPLHADFANEYIGGGVLHGVLLPSLLPYFFFEYQYLIIEGLCSRGDLVCYQA